jgi:hypothetical protein
VIMAVAPPDVINTLAPPDPLLRKWGVASALVPPPLSISRLCRECIFFVIINDRVPICSARPTSQTTSPHSVWRLRGFAKRFSNSGSSSLRLEIWICGC